MKIIQERKGNHEEKGGNAQCGKNEFSDSILSSIVTIIDFKFEESKFDC